jgi:hypothetical protein
LVASRDVSDASSFMTLHFQRMLGCCLTDVNKPGSIGTQVESRVRTPCGHGLWRQIIRPMRVAFASPPLLTHARSSLSLKDSGTPVRPLSNVHHHHHLSVNPTTTTHDSSSRLAQRIAPSTERRFDFRHPIHHQDMSSRGGKLAPEVNRYVRRLSRIIVNRQSSIQSHSRKPPSPASIEEAFKRIGANHLAELCS